MKALEGCAVHRLVHRGKPFTLLQCIPIPVGCCWEDLESPTCAQDMPPPSTEDCITFIVGDVPCNGQHDSARDLFRRYPQQCPHVH